MESIIKNWCEKHNSTLVEVRKNGFIYINANGMWYMPFDEM